MIDFIENLFKCLLSMSFRIFMIAFYKSRLKTNDGINPVVRLYHLIHNLLRYKCIDCTTAKNEIPL